MSRALTRGARAGLIVALALTSCAGMKDRMRQFDGTPIPAPRAWRDDALNAVAFQRVLALPLHDDSGQGAASGVISSALRDEILKLGRFDLVQPLASDAALKAEHGPKRTGRIEGATLVELGRRYGVDAVLFGAIDHYRPYDPPALGVSLSLVEVESGKILWHVRDFLDAADHDTSLAMRYFYEDDAAARDLVFQHDVMSTAPQWFARFAAQRLARTLAEPPPGV